MSSYISPRSSEICCKDVSGPSNCGEEVVCSPLQTNELEHYGVQEEVNSHHNDTVNDTPFHRKLRQSRNPSAKPDVLSAEMSPCVNVRHQPPRQSRVKSFKKLLQYSYKGDRDVDEKPSHFEMAPARVFVTNDVVGMHLDWPLYSQQAESFHTAAYIIVSEAALVRSSLICVTVPQEFTEVGTFVIAMSGLHDRHEVTQDGLGSWGTPQGTTKFYNFCSNGRRLTTAVPADYTYKVQCNRYIHPGTDDRGHFIRKIYCGMTSTGEGCSYAVTTYSWEGTPHPITVILPSSLPSRLRPYGARSWEAADIDLSLDEGVSHRGHPLLSRVAVDFSTACKILLAGVEIAQHRICAQVPRDFRDGGTFVVDIDSCGGERMLCRDGHEWSKPSGSSSSASSAGLRLIKSRLLEKLDEYQKIEVLAKRYECNDEPSFVRKIYVARDKSVEPRVNTHVAVLTYLWKSEPVIARANRDALIARKRQSENPEIAAAEGRALLGSNILPLRMKRPIPAAVLRQIVKPKAFPMIDVLSRVRLSHTDHLRRLALVKKSENLCRMAAILDRAEPILERFEQYYFGHSQDFRSHSGHEAVWFEQNQLRSRRSSDRIDQRGEECAAVNGERESIGTVSPCCVQTVYENSSVNGTFRG